MRRGESLTYSDFNWTIGITPGCPGCNGKLVRDRKGKTVHSGIADAVNFDLTDSEGNTLDEVYFEYDVFNCENCGRQMMAILVRNCFEAINKMKKQYMLNFDDKSVCYLYEVNPIDVHIEKHDCGECGKRLRMKSEEADISQLDSYEFKWMPFYNEETTPESCIIRRVYFVCPRCGKEYSTKEVLRQKVRGIKKYLGI